MDPRVAGNVVQPPLPYPKRMPRTGPSVRSVIAADGSTPVDARATGLLKYVDGITIAMGPRLVGVPTNAPCTNSIGRCRQ